jgi:protein O-mannosyl-transferase
MKSKLLWLLQAAAIILAGTWVYAPALRGDWLWDDVVEVSRNPVLREPAGAIGRIWFAPAGADYFPLKTTVQWAEWHLWGDHRLGYHLTSLALHLLSALLFWRLLRRLCALGGGPSGALGPWLGGLIFALHPLAVESVAWISELKNTLSLPPLLLAMICHVAGDAQPPGSARSRGFLLSLAWFVVAMLCKSSVVMFPVVLLLYAWWRRGRIDRADLRTSAPFFAISLGLGLVTLWFQHHRAIGEAGLAIGGWPSRVAGAGLATLFYLGKFLWPRNLLLIYPRWPLTPPSPAQFVPWVAIAATVGWLWAGRERGATPGRKRTVLFGLGCFGVNLVPVLGLVPMAYLRLSWVADHFAYVPMLGLIGLTAAGAGLAAERVRSRPELGRPGAVLLAGLLALLAFAARGHASAFRDEATLWDHTLQGNPDSWTAHNDLGLVLAAQGRLAEAERHYREALRLKPDFANAHNNLGLALGATGRTAEAIAQYHEALQVQPDYAEAHSNLGIALVATGRTTEAIAQYQEALRIRSDYAQAHNNLGVALRGLGQTAEAVAQFEQAVQGQPDFADAHNNLGLALHETGRTAEAVAQFEAAVRARPDFGEAHENLGLALHETGRIPEAIAQYEEALRLNPGDARAHNNLGVALRATGRTAEACAQFEEAARLRADPAPSP